MIEIKKEIILGIDPGTASVGWGLIEKTGRECRLIDYGCIRTKPDKKLSSRLLEIFDSLGDIIKKNRPDTVAVEQLFFFKNTKTAMAVGQARGVILLAAEMEKKEFYEYTPLQVKQAVTGYGRAEKKQIQNLVKELLVMKEIPKPDDAADALAVALCHAYTNQLLKNNHR